MVHGKEPYLTMIRQERILSRTWARKITGRVCREHFVLSAHILVDEIGTRWKLLEVTLPRSNQPFALGTFIKNRH